MKRSKYSEEQVAYTLRQAEAGTAVGDVCRQLGISEATFHVCKKRYGHLGVRAARPAPRGRECAVEAPGRGPDARQAHARGGPPAKELTPARRRELAGWFRICPPGQRGLVRAAAVVELWAR